MGSARRIATPAHYLRIIDLTCKPIHSTPINILKMKQRMKLNIDMPILYPTSDQIRKIRISRHSCKGKRCTQATVEQGWEGRRTKSKITSGSNMRATIMMNDLQSLCQEMLLLSWLRKAENHTGLIQRQVNLTFCKIKTL